MTPTAREMLDRTTARLAPAPHENPLVDRLAAGTAGPGAITVLAQEERHIVPGDLRAFRRLAERSAGAPRAAAFFTTLADGEAIAAEQLDPLLAACGLDGPAIAAYEPLAGCQAYPSYVAWLALNGAPSDVVLALTANFAAWGGYCATLGRALRIHYGFSDAACGFFDFFAGPAPELTELAEAAVQEGLERGTLTDAGPRYGALLQTYELMFWSTLEPYAADPGPSA
jgi:hypothetical protein